DCLEDNRKFITTEALGSNGEAGEKLVWQTIQKVFAQRDCIGYWRYPIFSQVGKSRQEPDILVVDWQLGLVIIEVKSVTIDQILAISGNRWEFCNYYTTYSNPYGQAENQLFTLLGYCDREPALRRKISGRVLICLPLISESQWYECGFYQLPSCPPIIFKDRLMDSGHPALSHEHPLLKQIRQTPPIIKGFHLKEEEWQVLKAVISGTPIFRQRLSIPQYTHHQTRGDILAQVRDRLSAFDLEQEHIGKEIPPGPQRIRGIAGSGKTAILCQKAAHIHLKHPDWDIALVFFSRSLYQPIIEQLDKWLRRFSGGEVGYDGSHLKLQVLHAWGAKNQPGLYGNICQVAGVKRLIPRDIPEKEPSAALAIACRELLQGRLLPQLYDAILIDEGQDLIVNNRLKFEGKQPFYWMAYQALRPVEPAQPEQRRLIWGYDEAQSLASLNIPSGSEIFGEELGHLVTGFYPGGIRKTETISRCYRTPSPILTAAHGIGMGLLRRGGILTGITRIEDWQALGYEVIPSPAQSFIYSKDKKDRHNKLSNQSQLIAKDKDSYPNHTQPNQLQPRGSFLPGQQITIKRPKENSPNPIPELWQGSLIDFIAYRSRQEELTALAHHIYQNIHQDKLKPSKEILIIILGINFEAMELETYVAQFLIARGINIYIPSALNSNILNITQDNRNPNQFWYEGAVTISRIHRAKGNEADMVYIVGLDNIAKDENNLQLRNQLFVALTRAKGWAKISGIGNYPLYEELWRVIQSRDSFTFTFWGNSQREISITETGELRSRYDAGGRNFQNADLTGARLAGADLREANLIGAILSHADLSHAKLDRAKFAIADLSKADLSYASLRKAKLVGANLQDAKLIGANLSWAKLGNSDLRNAELIGANLTGANLSGADLTGADLTGANLDKVDLSEVDLTEVKLSHRHS
ncbi:MAG TPA: DNA/RNA helicase, partial [Cyanobacteria bacterium UBA11366]|nr:DNA/RNA helicase [Cyanobacteria bacterium UBA11366]